MSSETPFRALNTESDWSEAMDRSAEGPVVIFKHSSTCPTSARANREMTTLATETDLPVYRVVVQQSRAVSDRIADALSIRHQTPQAIILQGGEPVFDASHHRVKADAVREAVEA